MSSRPSQYIPPKGAGKKTGKQSKKSIPTQYIVWGVVAVFVAVVAFAVPYDSVWAALTGPGKHAKYDELMEGPEEALAIQRPFFDWMMSNGFIIDTTKIKLHHLGKGWGFGVLAQRNLRRGEPLFRVPYDLVWHPKHHNSKPLHNAVIDYLMEELKIKEEVLLSTMELALDLRDPTNFWKPYFDSLSLPDCPYFFTEDELKEFQLTTIINSKGWTFDTTWGNYMALLPHLQGKFPEIFGTNTSNMLIPRAEIDYALALLLQRSFVHHGFWALVPYMDMINNKLVWDPIAKKYKNINNYADDPENRHWVNDCNSDYKKGDQLYDVYSFNYNSLEWMLQYGYAPENNMNDYIVLKVSVAQDDPHKEHKIAMLGGPAVKYILRMQDVRIPEIFLQQIAIALMSPDEFAYLKSTSVVLEEQKNDAYRLLLANIEAAVKGLPTTLAQDQTTLKSPENLSSRMYGIVAFRIETKKQMGRFLAQLKKTAWQEQQGAAFADISKLQDDHALLDIVLTRGK